MHLKRYRRMIAIGFIALICWTTYLVIDSNHIETNVSAGDAAFSIAFDKWYESREPIFYWLSYSSIFTIIAKYIVTIKFWLI